MSSKRLYVSLAVAICSVLAVWGVAVFLQQRGVGDDFLAPDPAAARAAKQVIDERKKLDETVWRSEVDAQRFEGSFVRLWDDLRGAENKTDVLKRFPFNELAFRHFAEGQLVDYGIRLRHATGAAKKLSSPQWQQLADQLHASGMRIVQTEWHHSKFEPGIDSAPRSEVSFTLHLRKAEPETRFILKGTLHIGWSSDKDDKGNMIADKIDVAQAQLLQTTRPKTFAALPMDLNADGFVAFYDLNRDGLMEIVHGPNSVYWNLGNHKFKRGLLCESMEVMLTCGALADVNGDGNVDLICGSQNSKLWWLKGHKLIGNSEFVFSHKPNYITADQLENPSAIAVGDVDGDGDLDLWVAQYKYPYVKGQMPTPYFDANDGYASHLLINDGQGTFTDRTEAAGLAAKRFRRTYSCSFLDLDDDNDLDLLVNSDFSGIDLYRNDGQGSFVDATKEWVTEWHNFGMSHTIGDFDLDGGLDFFITGMSSTTARRLDSLKVGRESHAEHQRMRSVMGFGNRMYLRRDGKFVEPSFKTRVARTGWSWGSTSFDFDNDGDRDIYIANGHISGKTARDYCTKFWCHDIYTGNSRPSAAMDVVFKTDSALNDMSWNGFEHNCLLMNLAGKDFLEIGFLQGLAFEFDSRAVVGGDLDNDGRVDLYVGEHQPAGFQKGHLFKNSFDGSKRKWIGVRLYEEGKGVTPIGAKIRIQTSKGPQVAQLVTGDSFNAQHGNVVHFGLGVDAEVEAIHVRWTNGRTATMLKPKAGEYHRISPAGE